MKFLKKPIFIKKIRFYNDSVKLNDLNIENKYKFISNKNILKSSYLEKVIDLNKDKSSLNLKGGYFYFAKNSESSFINLNNKLMLDPFGFKDSYDKISLVSNYFRLVSLKKTNLFLKFKT